MSQLIEKWGLEAEILRLCLAGVVVGAVASILVLRSSTLFGNAKSSVESQGRHTNALPDTAGIVRQEDAEFRDEGCNPSTTPFRERLSEAESEIWSEQSVRTRGFFGSPGQRFLEDSYVVIVGVGGVGSHCAMSLARSGVGRLRLIDFDQVTLSSLNRHATATLVDVGLPKVEALRRAIRHVVPKLNVELKRTLFCAASANELLLDGGRPNLVVDAIDNVVTKADLIRFCYQNRLRVISSGAAGARCDPTRIRIDPINETADDALARALRRRLKEIDSTLFADSNAQDIPKICYSLEKNSIELLPLLDFQKETGLAEFRPFDNFRVRVVPVIAPMPALFGQAIASYVLCELAHRPIPCLDESTKFSEACDRLSTRNYKLLFQAIKQYASRCEQTSKKELELDFRTSRHLYCEVFRGLSVLDVHYGTNKQRQFPPGALQVVPWCFDGVSLVSSFRNPNNLVCMEHKEALEHLAGIFPAAEQTQSRSGKIYSAEVVARVESILLRMKNQEETSTLLKGLDGGQASVNKVDIPGNR